MPGRGPSCSPSGNGTFWVVPGKRKNNKKKDRCMHAIYIFFCACHAAHALLTTPPFSLLSPAVSGLGVCSGVPGGPCGSSPPARSWHGISLGRRPVRPRQGVPLPPLVRGAQRSRPHRAAPRRHAAPLARSSLRSLPHRSPALPPHRAPALLTPPISSVARPSGRGGAGSPGQGGCACSPAHA